MSEMEFLSDFKKKVIAGKDVEEKSIYFILFKDHEVEKLCHARIDEIADDLKYIIGKSNRHDQAVHNGTSGKIMPNCRQNFKYRKKRSRQRD